MRQVGRPRQYPNVKARLRLTKMAPTLRLRENYMDIWMNGTRFRVRDESGRDVSTIIGDLSASRGLGVPARTMGEIMDARSPSRHLSDVGVAELYGDLATTEGWVSSAGEPRWPIAADQLAPAAEQVLDGGLDKRLEERGQVTCLGRPCTEYHGFFEGEDEGIPYKSEITRVVSPPYLLFSSVHDAQDAGHYYTREVVSLEEGVVTDLDLTVP